MFEFIIVIIIIVICYLLFGKADTKNTLLNQVGLNLSDENYKRQKESEFKNCCLKGMYNAIEKMSCSEDNELHFLQELSSVLGIGVYGEEENNLAYLRVKHHYLEHAERVVNRRIEKIRNEDTSPLLPNCDFSQKSDVKKYIKILWRKYQHPWPKDWLQGDSDL